jgi:predicted dehydrogenase
MIKQFKSGEQASRPFDIPRGIIVGAGYFGRHWRSILQRRTDCVVAAVVAADSETLESALAIGAATGSPRGYLSLDEAIAEVQPDFAVVAVPEFAHREVLCALIEAEINCLCEKPIAMTWEEAQIIAQACQRHPGLVVMIDQQFRWRPTIQALRTKHRAGHLGKLREIMIIHRQNIGRTTVGGWRERMEHPYLFDMAVHYFDLARYISGCEAESVSAHAYRAEGSIFVGAPSIAASITMSENVEVNVLGSFVARGFETLQEGAITLTGTEGTLRLDESGQLRFANGKRTDDIPIPALPEGDCDMSLSEFFRALRDGVPPATSISDNMLTFAMVIAAERSHRENRRVTIQEVLK